MGLARWQAAFAAALDSTQDSSVFLALLSANGGITHTEGLEVYRTNARASRLRALEAVFPVVREVLGVVCFEGVATHWVAETPSDTWDLNRSGKGFPDYLRMLIDTHEEYAVLPWLSDLGRFEWLLHRCYYQPDARASDFAVVADSAEPGCLVPRVAPSVDLMSTIWPVLKIWEDHQPGGDPGPLPEAIGRFHLVIERPNFHPRAEPVSKEEFDLLEACIDGWSLDRISQSSDLDAELLPTLIERGWLVGFSDPRNSDRREGVPG